MATAPLRQIEGKYEILEKIKEGGMGTIYKVRHRLLDEVRVVKVMRPQIADSEDLQRRFAREARAAIRLKHPNIAQLYDFAVEPEGIAYMVMEFIEGVTLQEMLASSGPAPVDLTLEIARQGLEALRYLHTLGYVHRDVAPDNLMLTKDFSGQPQVKLIDLGIVKHLAGGGEGLTATGMFLGKVRYSSPEQFSGEKGGVDQRSDLYSFGVMLYELLTGKCPIVGENLSQLVAAHLFQPPLPFDKTDPDGKVPDDIRAAVMRALAKAPEDRFASAQELQDKLVRQQPALNLAQDLETTLATTLNLRDIVGQAQPGTTQDRLDANFGMVQTPGPGAGLRAADGVGTGSPREQHAKLLARARRHAQAKEWEEARLLLYQALALDPDHGEVRTLLGTVETSLKQVVEEEKKRQAVASAAARVDAEVRAERPEEAGRELEQARASFGDQVEWPELEKRIASLRAALIERARQAEIAQVATRIGALLDHEEVEPARSGLDAASKRYGDEAALLALRARLAEVERRLEERRREQEAAARRERVKALLADGARLAAGGAFAEAIARAEQAVALDAGDARARQALERYRTDEAQRLEEIRRERAIEDAAARVAALLEREDAGAAGRELDAAVAALGADQRLEKLSFDLAALRQTLEARERERVRRQAIGEAVEAIGASLAAEDAAAAQSRLEAAVERLGDDAELDAAAERIAALRDVLAERERQRLLEQERREEEERVRREQERRRQEEEQRRRAAEARKKEEERRQREAAEAKRKEEERLAREAEAKRQEEERRERAEAEARRQAAERRQQAEAEARRREAEKILAKAADQSRAGDLAAAIETARSAMAIDAAAAGATVERLERAFAAEQRAERLSALLDAARTDLEAGRLDPALDRLESGRDEYGEEAGWSDLLARTQAEIAHRETERRRLEAVATEAEAIERLIEKGKIEKAEKRLGEARSELGAAAEWASLASRFDALRAEAARAREAQAAAEARRREEQEEERERAAQKRDAERAAERQRKEERAAQKQLESQRAAEQEREAKRAAAARESQRAAAPTLRAPDAPSERGVKPVVWAAAAGALLVIAIVVWMLQSGGGSGGGSTATGDATSEVADTGVPLDARASGPETRPAGQEPPFVPPARPGSPDAGASDASGDQPQSSTSLDAGRQGAASGTVPEQPEPLAGKPRVAEAAEPAARGRESAPPPVAAPRNEPPPSAPPNTAADRSTDRPNDAAARRDRPAEPVEPVRLPVEQLPAARVQPTLAPPRQAPPPPPAPQAEAPPVAAAPAQSTDQPKSAPAPAADEQQKVLDTLARYRAAYQSLDADAVARVFTGADVRELRRAFKQTRSMSVSIDLAGCEIKVTGDTAAAACNVSRVTEPKAGERMTRSQREAFDLRKTASGWVVERVR